MGQEHTSRASTMTDVSNWKGGGGYGSVGDTQGLEMFPAVVLACELTTNDADSTCHLLRTFHTKFKVVPK